MVEGSIDLALLQVSVANVPVDLRRDNPLPHLLQAGQRLAPMGDRLIQLSLPQPEVAEYAHRKCRFAHIPQSLHDRQRLGQVDGDRCYLFPARVPDLHQQRQMLQAKGQQPFLAFGPQTGQQPLQESHRFLDIDYAPVAEADHNLPEGGNLLCSRQLPGSFVCLAMEGNEIAHRLEPDRLPAEEKHALGGQQNRPQVRVTRHRGMGQRPLQQRNQFRGARPPFAIAVKGRQQSVDDRLEPIPFEQPEPRRACLFECFLHAGERLLLARAPHQPYLFLKQRDEVACVGSARLLLRPLPGRQFSRRVLAHQFVHGKALILALDPRFIQQRAQRAQGTAGDRLRRRPGERPTEDAEAGHRFLGPFPQHLPRSIEHGPHALLPRRQIAQVRF